MRARFAFMASTILLLSCGGVQPAPAPPAPAPAVVTPPPKVVTAAPNPCDNRVIDPAMNPCSGQAPEGEPTPKKKPQ